MTPDRLRLERSLLLGGLGLALLVCLGPVSNPDLPWHLAVGRRIAAEGAVPRADYLSWTLAGEPWVDFEWLTQLLFHSLHSAGGAAALWALKVVSFGLLSLVFAALLRLWGFSPGWIGVAVVALTTALRPFIQVRPENFSLLLFSLQLLALEARRLDRLRLPGPALLAAHAAAYALWANLHAGFPMGLLLCACYALGELRSPARPAGLPAWTLGLAGLAGTLANPYGPRLYTVLWAHWQDLPALRSMINEWTAPRLGSVYLNGYWVLFLLSLAGGVACAALRVPLPAEHLLVVLAFGAWGSRSVRTTAYLTLAVFPLGLLAWSRLPRPARWREGRSWALGAAAALAAWGAVAILRHDGFPAPIKPPSDLEPERACAFLRAEKGTLGPLKLYNPWNWGGYLDDVLYPDYRVYMDGRYIFTDLLKEVDEAEASPPRLAKLLDRRGADLALLMNTGRIVSFRGQTSWRPFDAYAFPKKEWALVYWDRQALVLVRRSKVPEEWLKPREFRHVRPHDLRYVGLRVLSGWTRLDEVRAEVARYEREIGDPFETLVLKNWLEKFSRGLEQTAAAARAARTRPRPAPSGAAAPRL